MEPVGEPDIDIDDDRPWTYGTQGRLRQRNRVISEGSVELLVEQDLFLPVAWLLIRGIGHVDSAVDEGASPHNLIATPVGIEGEGASRYPPSLIRHLLISFTAN